MYERTEADCKDVYFETTCERNVPTREPSSLRLGEIESGEAPIHHHRAI